MGIDVLNRIPVQPWMCADGARRIMRALNASAPDSTRFVGGCVRNALMGVAVSDVDIATQWTPEEVVTKLRAAGISVHRTGIEHGTVTAVTNKVPYEITTLRRDVATDGRRAVVAFTKSWEEDAQRRDFHVNALYADIHGKLFDPTGRGLSDLREQRIAFIGNADERLQEDFLRILRFFRFSAWYSSGRLDTDGLGACMRQREGLRQISAERIWSELKKLLNAPDPRVAMMGMSQTGVLSIILPESMGLDLFNNLVELELREQLPIDPILRLLSLYPKDVELIEADTKRLKMSRKEADRLLRACRDTTDFTLDYTSRTFRKAIYHVGRDIFADRARLAWAVRGQDADHRYWKVLVESALDYERPTFPISGDHVVAMGVPAGKDVGEVLKRIEDWWIEADFPNDVAGIARQMKRVCDDVISRQQRY